MVKVAELDIEMDLSVKNPIRSREIIGRQPEKIIEELLALDSESVRILQSIRELLRKRHAD